MTTAIKNGGGSPDAVVYDSSAHNKLTLGGTGAAAPVALSNVAKGTQGTDAVNLDQLKAAGAVVDSTGGVSNSFVAYDAGKGTTSVTLGTGTVGAQIHQVVAGTADTDALNVGQLKAAGIAIGTDGKPTNSFVAYDAGKGTTSVTLGTGTVGAQIHQVVAGSADTDAINLSQLKAMGGTVDSNGKPTNAFVAYDSPSKNSVTLAGGTDGTQIHQVKAGSSDLDAVNVAQLNTATAASTQVALSLKYVRFGASDAPFAQATGTDSMALGGNSVANATNALAIGTNARAFGTNSVALGAGSSTNDDNTISVGSAFVKRRITNVDDGTSTNDAVNLGQVQGLIAKAAPQLVKSSVRVTPGLLGATSTGSLTPAELIMSGPTDKAGMIEATGVDAIAIGLNTHATADKTVAIGQNVNAVGKGAVAMGNGTFANGLEPSAIGVKANVIADHALAVGYMATGETVNSIAIGSNAQVGGAGVGGVAIGNTSFVSGVGAMVLGNSSTATGADTFVIGNKVTSAGKNSVVLGSGSDGSANNVISVGAKGSERAIVNVKDGSADTDAATYGQLTKAIAGIPSGTGLVTQANATADVLVASATGGTHVNFAGNGVDRELTGVASGKAANSAVNLSQLTPVVAALGGGAKVDPTTGAVTGPTYSIQGAPKTNVGDALTSLDTGLTTLPAQVNNTGTGLVVQKGDANGDITIGANTGGDVIDVSSNVHTRKVTGVANGDLSSSSVDAVNGSQLYSAASGLATAIGGGAALMPDGTISQPSFNVGGNTVHNVGDALSNIDTRVTSNTNSLTQLQTTVNNMSGNGGGGSPEAVLYDSTAHDKITLGANGATAALTNLTDATLSATSTDAVTGKQLFDTNNKVDQLTSTMQNIATTGSTSIGINGTNGADGAPGTPGVASATGSDAIAMGNGASANGNGAIVIGGGASGTADGVIAIGEKSNASGKDSIAMGNGASAPATNAVALGANSVADRDNTVSMGSEGNERQVTNVAAGTKGTDAVNLNQMNSAMGGISRKAYSGIAAATALTMIPDVDANKTLSIGIGGGTFQG